MKIFQALLIFSLWTFNRCSEKPADAMQLSALQALSAVVPDSVRFGDAIRLTVTCSTPTPCWKFKGFEVSAEGNQYDVTVYAEYDGRPCIQILGSITADTAIVPRQRGEYTFRFRQDSQRMIEKNVLVQ